MSSKRKSALGKGLGALLGSSSPLASTWETTPEEPSASEPSATSALPVELPIDQLRPNPYQPRHQFDEEKLTELADSIREHGVLQPLLVCADPEFPGKYLLLAGERRWRASQRLGLGTVPVRVVEAKDHQQLEFALIENLQRDDLNPVEEARAYQELAQQFNYTQDQVAKRVGKSRVAVANSLRLLKLSENTLLDLEEGRLTAGHARALLMLGHRLQQEALRKEIMEKEMTVRQAEERARDYQQGRVESPEENKKSPAFRSEKGEKNSQQNLDVEHLAEQLTVLLGCKVQVKPRTAKSGRLEISYRTLDDLDRVLDLLGLKQDLL
ncbi:MAG: ParB/RepB/Spo0J family partition protein [Candidatus Sumerlaeia bacterium]|nr:ParB/RepB/Spo0J family partition protein [Candidatus Sumerlaeia bacterium]